MYLSIALRSLAGACGVFDTAMEKIPPDIPSLHGGISKGGSLDSVRDWPTQRSLSSCSSSSLSSSSDSDFSSFGSSSVSSSPIFRPHHGNSVGGSVGGAFAKVVYPHTPPQSDSALNNGVFASSPLDGPGLGGPDDSGAASPKKNFVPRDVHAFSVPAPQSDPSSISVQKALGNNGNFKTHSYNHHSLATPPLTPDDDVPSAMRSAGRFGDINNNDNSIAGGAVARTMNDSSAADFLLRLFPGSVRMALSYAKSVRISSSELSGATTTPSASGVEDTFAFEGIILDIPGQPRTLYIDGKGAENVKLRER